MQKLLILNPKYPLAGMTLLEMLATVIIIGILVAVALPNFASVQEKALDKEATATLKLIQDAEKFYKLEVQSYYPTLGSVTDAATINLNLKLSLPTDTGRKWNYSCSSNGCVDATRFSGPNARTWRLRINESEPTSSVVCP